ncbi:hypothetical protein AA0482_0167 [Acetobacter cibinongensis NRIC 0482]|nr:hypothetical protein AA0482_0167 [Acetobacter cibinongensis NRIC 0482]
MIDKQELHDRSAGTAYNLGIRQDFHTVRNRKTAGRNGLGGAYDLHKAHTAVTRNRQPLMVAEARYFLTCGFTGLESA